MDIISSLVCYLPLILVKLCFPGLTWKRWLIIVAVMGTLVLASLWVTADEALAYLTPLVAFAVFFFLIPPGVKAGGLR